MSQIVAVRGWLPKPLSHMLYQVIVPLVAVSLYIASNLALVTLVTRVMPHQAFPQYVQCVHRADERFVQGLHQVEKEGLVPSWWANTEKAPGTNTPLLITSNV